MLLTDLPQDNWREINKYLCPTTRFSLGLTHTAIRKNIAIFMKERSERIYLDWDILLCVAHAYIDENGRWLYFIYDGKSLIRQEFLKVTKYDIQYTQDIEGDEFIIGSSYMTDRYDYYKITKIKKIYDITNSHAEIKLINRFCTHIFRSKADNLLVIEDYDRVYYIRNVTYFKSDESAFCFKCGDEIFEYKKDHIIHSLNYSCMYKTYSYNVNTETGDIVVRSNIETDILCLLPAISIRDV